MKESCCLKFINNNSLLGYLLKNRNIKCFAFHPGIKFYQNSECLIFPDCTNLNPEIIGLNTKRNRIIAMVKIALLIYPPFLKRTSMIAVVIRNK